MLEPEGEEEVIKKGESIKIVLIGNSGVGKTCISQRYVNEYYIEQQNSTVGASYLQKYIELNGKSFQLDIWDTAGQEKYRSMGKMFYKDAYIVLFIYDTTDEESFKDLKKIWYKELKNAGEKNTVLAVVGNKCDLFTEEKVKVEDAKKWANEIGAIFALVSAKTGDCVTSLFENCIKKYLSPDFVAEIKLERNKKGPIKKIEINEKIDKKDKNNKINKKKGKWFC